MNHGPARNYSWAPITAEDNHRRKTTHGARSPRVYGPIAEELAAGIVERRPDLDAYPEALAAWAPAEAQAALLREHVERVGTLDEDGQPRESLLRHLSSAEGRADKARQRLGLDPRADADLARSRAEATHAQVDLAGIAAAGRQALERRGGVEVLGTRRVHEPDGEHHVARHEDDGPEESGR